MTPQRKRKLWSHAEWISFAVASINLYKTLDALWPMQPLAWWIYGATGLAAIIISGLVGAIAGAQP